ncbi:putative phosphohistidine phosphatase, SixA [Thioalkalivibrio nitratireducens DSM 14787]|uniref:Phosphohistidine phosphatase, SixA n=2 Tax=Thioalkalivibrio nitratireducens TaxID=186931 RepID=L0DUH2_THIND|nr:putative phosphohistidine phosphatase, SixA [Thioalkalivibrio nitratireducens DSM 14787]
MKRSLTPPFLGSLVAAATLMLAAGAVAAGEEGVLWNALAEGGKVVMIRHAATEEASAEVSMNLAEDGDCSKEQNLTEAGRDQARVLGDRFQDHEVAVDGVLSSQYCRARETGELAFGRYEAWNALNLAEALPADDAEFLMEDVRERMGDFEGDGNLVMVTHRSNINTITFRQTEPGDIVVVEPDAFGGFTVLGTIAWEVD